MAKPKGPRPTTRVGGLTTSIDSNAMKTRAAKLATRRKIASSAPRKRGGRQ
jgi:hypothetical protein